MTRLIAVGASCAFAGFLAGVIACYFWFQTRPSPAVTNTHGPIVEEAGAGDAGWMPPGNDNNRAAKFAELDTDQDGKLSLAEFSVGREPGEAAKWFERRDVDHDGFISREEFLPFSPVTKRVQ